MSNSIEEFETMPIATAKIFGYQATGIEVELVVKVDPQDFVCLVTIPFSELFGDGLNFISYWPRLTMEGNSEASISGFTPKGIIIEIMIFTNDHQSLKKAYFIKYKHLINGKPKVKELSA